ncbi:unnamed protein product [Amoebophrya sp. A25]|nr:unnamed protein product [Amoebophrya sp. A25]|eukprot:GSA25T00022737001.1
MSPSTASGRAVQYSHEEEFSTVSPFLPEEFLINLRDASDQIASSPEELQHSAQQHPAKNAMHAQEGSEKNVSPTGTIPWLSTSTTRRSRVASRGRTPLQWVLLGLLEDQHFLLAPSASSPSSSSTSSSTQGSVVVPNTMSSTFRMDGRTLGGSFFGGLNSPGSSGRCSTCSPASATSAGGSTCSPGSPTCSPRSSSSPAGSSPGTAASSSSSSGGQHDSSPGTAASASGYFESPSAFASPISASDPRNGCASNPTAPATCIARDCAHASDPSAACAADDCRTNSSLSQSCASSEARNANACAQNCGANDFLGSLRRWQVTITESGLELFCDEHSARLNLSLNEEDGPDRGVSEFAQRFLVYLLDTLRSTTIISPADVTTRAATTSLLSSSTAGATTTTPVEKVEDDEGQGERTSSRTTTSLDLLLRRLGNESFRKVFGTIWKGIGTTCLLPFSSTWEW